MIRAAPPRFPRPSYASELPGPAASRAITRLTRLLLAWERGCEYAGVGLEENKALVRRYYQEVLTGRDRDLLTRRRGRYPSRGHDDARSPARPE